MHLHTAPPLLTTPPHFFPPAHTSLGSSASFRNTSDTTSSPVAAPRSRTDVHFDEGDSALQKGEQIIREDRPHCRPFVSLGRRVRYHDASATYVAVRLPQPRECPHVVDGVVKERDVFPHARQQRRVVDAPQTRADRLHRQDSVAQFGSQQRVEADVGSQIDDVRVGVVPQRFLKCKRSLLL